MPQADSRGVRLEEELVGCGEPRWDSQTAWACALRGLQPPRPLVTWEAKQFHQTQIPSVPQGCLHHLALCLRAALAHPETPLTRAEQPVPLRHFRCSSGGNRLERSAQRSES